MTPIHKAYEIYKQHNANFAESLDWHFANGVVISMPDYFLLAFFCDRNDTWQPLPLCNADCVHVTMCVGDMHQAGLQIIELVPWLAYEREFKRDNRTRIINFKKFFNKI